MARSTRAPILLRAVSLVFTAASLGFAGVLVVRHGTDLAGQWADLRAAGWALRPGWLSVALAAATANLFLLGWTWVRLLRAMGGTIGYLEGMRIWTWTNLGRYLPGRVWQISALTFYLREKRRIGGIGLGSSLVLQVLMLAVGAALSFAILGVRVAEGRTALIVGAALVTAVGFALALRPATVGWMTARMSRAMGEPDPGVEPSSAALWKATGFVTVSWFLYGIGLWCLWRGAGGQDGPDVWFWTGAFAAAYLTGYVALIAPAGLVVRETALAALLVGLGGMGAPAAAGIAVLARLWAIASELVAAALAWVLPGDATDNMNAGETPVTSHGTTE